MKPSSLKTRAKHPSPLTPGFNHDTKRKMERHPLDFSWRDLVSSGVLDKLRENPERLGFEERYYVQTGEKYAASPYPEAETYTQPLERFFDPLRWLFG